MVEKLIRAKNPPFRNIPDIESQVLYWLRPDPAVSSLRRDDQDVFHGRVRQVTIR